MNSKVNLNCYNINIYFYQQQINHNAIFDDS